MATNKSDIKILIKGLDQNTEANLDNLNLDEKYRFTLDISLKTGTANILHGGGTSKNSLMSLLKPFDLDQSIFDKYLTEAKESYNEGAILEVLTGIAIYQFITQGTITKEYIDQERKRISLSGDDFSFPVEQSKINTNTLISQLKIKITDRIKGGKSSKGISNNEKIALGAKSMSFQDLNIEGAINQLVDKLQNTSIANSISTKIQKLFDTKKYNKVQVVVLVDGGTFGKRERGSSNSFTNVNKIIYKIYQKLKSLPTDQASKIGWKFFLKTAYGGDNPDLIKITNNSLTSLSSDDIRNIFYGQNLPLEFKLGQIGKSKTLKLDFILKAKINNKTYDFVLYSLWPQIINGNVSFRAELPDSQKAIKIIEDYFLSKSNKDSKVKIENGVFVLDKPDYIKIKNGEIEKKGKKREPLSLGARDFFDPSRNKDYINSKSGGEKLPKEPKPEKILGKRGRPPKINTPNIPKGDISVPRGQFISVPEKFRNGNSGLAIKGDWLQQNAPDQIGSQYNTTSYYHVLNPEKFDTLSEEISRLKKLAGL